MDATQTSTGTTTSNAAIAAAQAAGRAKKAAEEQEKKAAAKAATETARAAKKTGTERLAMAAKAKREQDAADRKAAKAAADSKPRLCLCGCKGETKSRFVPGHDAKLKSAILIEQRWFTVRAMLEVADQTAVDDIREQLGMLVAVKRAVA